MRGFSGSYYGHGVSGPKDDSGGCVKAFHDGTFRVGLTGEPLLSMNSRELAKLDLCTPHICYVSLAKFFK